IARFKRAGNRRDRELLALARSVALDLEAAAICGLWVWGRNGAGECRRHPPFRIPFDGSPRLVGCFSWSLIDMHRSHAAHTLAVAILLSAATLAQTPNFTGKWAVVPDPSSQG